MAAIADIVSALRGALVDALLGASDGRWLVKVAEAARALGVDEGYLYRHQRQLGAIRLGTCPKAPV
jgi:uncharacterized membrane protein